MNQIKKDIATIFDHLNRRKPAILMIELNEDGTYGEDHLNEAGLKSMIALSNYAVVFIDDITNAD